MVRSYDTETLRLTNAQPSDTTYALLLHDQQDAALKAQIAKGKVSGSGHRHTVLPRLKFWQFDIDRA